METKEYKKINKKVKDLMKDILKKCNKQNMWFAVGYLGKTMERIAEEESGVK